MTKKVVETVLRICGVIVGLLGMAVFGTMLVESLETDTGMWGMWGMLGKISGVLTGFVFVAYGISGRKKFKNYMPGAGRNLRD